MKPLRVLHVAATSVPHVNGYTMRLASIVREQAQRGLDPRVLTAPFYPGRLQPPTAVSRDGVDYQRCQHPLETTERGWRAGAVRSLRSMAKSASCPRPLAGVALLAEERLLLNRFERDIERAAADQRVDLIHAHTPYRCALPAIAVARRLGLPVIYEVRGLWEDTAVAEGRIQANGATYRHVRRSEDRALRSADAVIAIGEALASDCVARGALAARTFVAPNGADLQRLDLAASDVPAPVKALQDRTQGALIIGYVGSLRPLEGVEALVSAIASLVARGHDVRGLVVGDGESRPSLIASAHALGVADRIEFTGRVPAEEVGAYYDLIDVFAVTRARSRVSEIVTPIKPLEAMGRGKPVVMAALPALRELGAKAHAARFYRPDDADDLAERLAELLGDADERSRLGERARCWVTSERTWAATVDRIEEAYRAVLAR